MASGNPSDWDMEQTMEKLRSWLTVDIVGAVGAAVVSVLVLSWISRKFFGQYRHLKLPPGPRGYPILGAIPHLGSIPHFSFYELAKKYGPVMFMKMGSMPTLIISDADSAKEVLQTSDHIFASRPRLTIPSVLSYDQQDLVFAPYGPHWRQLRKICNFELLTHNRVVHFTNLIKKEIRATVHHILRNSEKNETQNISKTLTGMTTNIISQMMWNKRHLNLLGDYNRFEEVFEKVVVVSGTNNLIDFLPDFIPSFASLAIKFVNFDNKGRVAHKELDKFIEEVIHEREEAWANGVRAKETEEDFLDALLKITSKKGESQDPQKINWDTLKATLTDMLIAGRDTSSTTMDWCLSELMRNPRILKKVQDELTEVVGLDRMVQDSDIPKLKYLDCLIKETLRRRNPAPLTVPHYSMAECKVGGHDVPVNTVLFVNFFAVHHDEKVWDKPFEFNPDRFLDSDMDLGGKNFNYLPFGAGRRMCVGLNLASTVLHQALAQLLHCVEWSLPEGQGIDSVDMTEHSGLFLGRKEYLHIVAKPRLNPEAYAPLS